MEGTTDSLRNGRFRHVRRRLFQDDGDNDDQQKFENSENRFSEEMRLQLEQSTKRWNFDFVRGEPQPGRYEWVRLDEHGNEISKSNGTNGIINTREESAEKEENDAKRPFSQISG
ncbi:hypothetical protein PUN28_014774 [Cardiocondyla obscurior]|uniref:Cyclin-dependent kinase inhibitor domain-containing protein n=1 Tax=Cardiocondyla obscurior TaxID=286306 RepID=A0AAW2EZ62_9HYME